MAEIHLKINDRAVTVDEGRTVLQAALEEGIYIPTLCSHPDLPDITAVQPSEFVYQGNDRVSTSGEVSGLEGGCRLCQVQIAGVAGLSYACQTGVREGMVVTTTSPEIQAVRKKNLARILADHPHACLTCAQREGCTREPCSSNVAVRERCCSRLGNCELQRVAEYVGIPDDTPRFIYQNLAVLTEDPLYNRDFNLCIGCLRCVRACGSLRGCEVLGFAVRDGKAAVGTRKAPLLKDADCSFCGACVEVCPTGALVDKSKITEANREKSLVPCRNACPAGIDVPRYIRCITQGKYDESLAVIREKIPFPAVCGMACFHPCETKCRRDDVDESIAIMRLKRVAAEKGDDALWKRSRKLLPSTGKRAAVVGAGPAGLTAAYHLARLGHEVTVFEALPQPGGMMIAGIPAYRLPREILDKEIGLIKELGVKIELNRKIESMTELAALGFDAIFLAMGAHRGTKLQIPGEELPGVVDCLSFLREVNLGGKDVQTGDRVAVIGGGNAAIDAARTAVRLGAKEVTILYRRGRDEMPADKCEVAEAEQEGVTMHFLVAPLRIESADGLLKMECICMQLGAPDAGGRARPEPVACSEFNTEFDQIVVATGQEPDVPAEMGISLAGSGRIAVAQDALCKGKEGIFAGGDVVSGPASVIEAIAAGRSAASAMDRYLGGTGVIDEELLPYENPSPWIGKVSGFAGHSRLLDVCSCSLDNGAEAIGEAKRCLQCDLRLQLAGVKPPPEHYLEFNRENVSHTPDDSGVIQLLDKEKMVILIKGVMNIREELEREVARNENAKWFEWELDEMFTKRESELIQQYLQKYGKMPGGGMDELDDLF